MYIAEGEGWHQALGFPLTPKAPQGPTTLDDTSAFLSNNG